MSDLEPGGKRAVAVVRCRHCDQIFHDRRFWALPKNDPVPRARCPRCFHKGPFMPATVPEARRQAEQRARRLEFTWALELVGAVVLLLLMLWRFWHDR